MTDYWCFTAVVSGQTLPLETGLEVVMGAEALSVEQTDAGPSMVQAWFADEPERSLLAEVISRSAGAGQIADQQLICHRGRDWLAENRDAFVPLRLGPFWIYGSHIRQAPPAGSLPLLVDAAQAFGSGTHPTTQTCLLALAGMRKAKRPPRRILDMGCGSAILAMAGMRLFPAATLLAADNDAVSVRTARRNRRINHISPMNMRVILSEGFAARDIVRAGPYDLIMANILAGPLRRMAGDLTGHLRVRGQLILSGLLHSQARRIIGDYRERKMKLIHRLDQEDWCCLVFQKRRAG